jgi:pSer/pThr/pTyr-binding forkhead associated (FHA) protein
MIQLRILSGSRKGTVQHAGTFPFSIGRAAAAQLRLEDPGVWDQHLKLVLNLPAGFQLEVQPGALASVNGQPCQQTPLRNGDVIEIGLVKLQFWLSEVEQPSLATRERLTWALIVVLALLQLTLLAWLVN